MILELNHIWLILAQHPSFDQEIQKRPSCDAMNTPPPLPHYFVSQPASFELGGDSGAQETKCGQGYVRFGDDDNDDGDDYDPRPGEGATGAARSSKGNCEID